MRKRKSSRISSKINRARTPSERRENELKRSYKKLNKSNKEGDFILISRLVKDLAKSYYKGSMVDFMLILMDKVDHLLKPHKKDKFSLISIPGLPSKLLLSIKTMWTGRHSGTARLVIVEVDESFVGYQIDNLKNIIVSQAVDDMLSKN